MKILMIGDVFGRVGRDMLFEYSERGFFGADAVLPHLPAMACCGKCTQLPSSSSQKQQSPLQVLGYCFLPLNFPLCLTACWIYNKCSGKVNAE